MIRQIEINIDYILMLVKKYHDTHCEDKEVLISPLWLVVKMDNLNLITSDFVSSVFYVPVLLSFIWVFLRSKTIGFKSSNRIFITF